MIFSNLSGPAAGAYPFYFTRRLHWLQYGQSTSIGAGAASGLTVGAYGAQMFNTGLRVNSVDGGGMPASTIAADETAAIGSGGNGETGAVSGANQFRDTLAAIGAAEVNTGPSFAMMVSAGGYSGQTIANLSKGTARYAEFIAMATNASNIFAGAKESYSVAAVPFVQGEQDYRSKTPEATYIGRLWALAADIATDARFITGQDWTPPLLVAQVASHAAHYAADATIGWRPFIAVAQRNAGRANRQTPCVMPAYVLPFAGDGINHTAAGYELQGRYLGRAGAQILWARHKGLPDPVVAVDLKHVSWQGKVVDLEFDAPVGPLALDTTQVASVVNNGFDVWAADGVTLLDIIQSVAVYAPNRVQIKMSAAPPSGARLSYGWGRPGVTTGSGPTTGPRGNLRDSAGSVDFYTNSLGATQRLDNWCLIFEAVKP